MRWVGHDNAFLVGTLIRGGAPMSGSQVCVEAETARHCTKVDALGDYGLSFPPGVYLLTLRDRLDTEPLYSEQADFPIARVYRDRIVVPKSSDSGYVVGNIASPVDPSLCGGSISSVESPNQRTEVRATPGRQLLFYNVPPGAYQMTLRCDGAPPATISPIRVRSGLSESFRLALPTLDSK